MSFLRSKKLITQAIKATELNLSGLTVLTEVASNNFIYTPAIAVMAGAKQVFAWTKSSSYGEGNEIVEMSKRMFAAFEISSDFVEYSIENRPERHIQQADIVTNLGMVRPIDLDFIRHLKKTAVVSYMCEAWEVRPGDVDIVALKERGIPVAGTWENHPDLKIFDACGPLAAKLVFEAGFEIYQNRIAIVSEDHFGEVAKATFDGLGASEAKIYNAVDSQLIQQDDYDFIFLADYSTSTDFLSNNINSVFYEKRIPVVHLCGSVLFSQLDVENQSRIYPKVDGFPKRMSRTLASLGPKPIIDLHAAGLKVGEGLVRQQQVAFSQLI